MRTIFPMMLCLINYSLRTRMQLWHLTLENIAVWGCVSHFFSFRLLHFFANKFSAKENSLSFSVQFPMELLKTQFFFEQSVIKKERPHAQKILLRIQLFSFFFLFGSFNHMLFMNNHLFSHSFLGKIITHNRIAILLVEKEKKNGWKRN